MYSGDIREDQPFIGIFYAEPLVYDDVDSDHVNYITLPCKCMHTYTHTHTHTHTHTSLSTVPMQFEA